MFPNLNKVLVETLAIQLFNNVDNFKQFKGTLRDLMVSMRSFSAQENDFYEHEKKVSNYTVYFIYLFIFSWKLKNKRRKS